LLGGAASAEDRGTVTPDDWPQYNYDNLGTRHNARERTLSPENAARLEEKWRFPRHDSGMTIGVVHATPVVVEGFVYFGTCDPATFYKLSPDGELVWSYEIPPGTDELDTSGRETFRRVADNGLDRNDDVVSAALVTETRVYFGTFSGLIICLDRMSGREVWRINTKVAPFPGAHVSNIVISSPIIADGTLIVPGGGFEHDLPTLDDYPCCSGRGFVVGLDPETGFVRWKYDVGPEPEIFDPPLVLEHDWGSTTFHAGPSTSSVWTAPSFDERTGTIFFGTDTNNAPRRPTPDDARLHTEYSCAIIAIDVADGRERWVCQLAPADVWNYTMRAWDPKTGAYKDLSIGDTPKLYDIEHDGRSVPVVGVGCKNGGYYVIDRTEGHVIHHTPLYQGPPVPGTTASAEDRILAVPCTIGGLQTGCAFDGKRVYTNGIDFPTFGTQEDQRMGRYYAPTGGRVTALRPDALAEHWRHERPKCDTPRLDYPDRMIRSGDPVGSGIAVANGLLFFTTTVCGKLVVVDAETGRQLRDFDLGPVWCGPSVSRGRVYVGTGNRFFKVTDAIEPGIHRFQFPKNASGAVYCFGLSEE
jgi:polyvinyl alcohol dehydrogenase (cytochrome)